MADICDPDPLFGDYADAVESARYGEPVLPIWQHQPLHPHHRRLNQQPQLAEAFATSARSMAAQMCSPASSPPQSPHASSSQTQTQLQTQGSIRSPRHTAAAPQSSLRRTRTSSSGSITKGPPCRMGSMSSKSPDSVAGRGTDREKGAYGPVPPAASSAPDNHSTKSKEVPRNSIFENAYEYSYTVYGYNTRTLSVL